jgi:hypothetical protein
MRKAVSVALALAMTVFVAGAQEKGKGGGGKGKGGFQLPPSIQIMVEGTTDGGKFPTVNVAQGGSPKISWTQVPAGTASFVLLFHDPDPVIGKNSSPDVLHWLVWNIPGNKMELPANFPMGNQPDGTMQTNIQNQAKYMGPAPPAGHGPHHYTVEMWALDVPKLDVMTSGPQARIDVMKAMDGHVLAKGYFATTFENK